MLAATRGPLSRSDSKAWKPIPHPAPRRCPHGHPTLVQAGIGRPVHTWSPPF